MTLIAERLVPILRSLPQGVRLAAVSKFHPVEELMEAYEAGQRVFAESRVQELMRKVEAMPDDVEWHFIGPLQTNKVKYIVPFISMIQSVSSLKLFDEISRQASKVGRTVPILLEVHIASEDTKSGFTPEELPQVLEAVLARGSDTGVKIAGLMGMATFTDDREQIRREFRRLASLFREMKERFFSDSADFCELSMGMSGDFELAIEEGSTIVRIGTTIFGERRY